MNEVRTVLWIYNELKELDGCDCANYAVEVVAQVLGESPLVEPTSISRELCLKLSSLDPPGLYRARYGGVTIYRGCTPSS